MTPRPIALSIEPRIRQVAKPVTKTVTLTEPEVAGEWDIEPLDGGRLLLTPHVETTIDELQSQYGERVQGDEFARRWAHLPSDGEG